MTSTKKHDPAKLTSGSAKARPPDEKGGDQARQGPGVGRRFQGFQRADHHLRSQEPEFKPEELDATG